MTHDGFDQARQFFAVYAGFRRFRIELHLDQHAQPILRQRNRSDSFLAFLFSVFSVSSVVKSFLARSSFSANGTLSTESMLSNRLDGPRGLIFLHVADHVPRRVEPRQLRQLRLPFLHAIFAEMADSGFVQF